MVFQTAVCSEISKVSVQFGIRIWAPAQDFFYFLSRKVQSGSELLMETWLDFGCLPYLTHHFQVLEFLLISWWVYFGVFDYEEFRKMCSVVPCLK